MKGLIVSSLFVAGTAFAQAPGEYSDSESVSPPGMQPSAEPGMQPPGMAPVAPPPQEAPPPPPPPERRWSIGLGIGSLNIAPHHDPESENVFSVGMIAVRWRPFRHLELELALSGGNTDSESDKQREVSQGVFALRWRFNPQSKWNIWAMAGMGTLKVSDAYYGEGPEQSTLQFGLGLERRWSRFALQLEGRIVGVAPPDDEDTMPSYPNQSYDSGYVNDGWKGGQLVLSGNFYF